MCQLTDTHEFHLTKSGAVDRTGNAVTPGMCTSERIVGDSEIGQIMNEKSASQL